jgi:hypothetical protein
MHADPQHKRKLISAKALRDDGSRGDGAMMDTFVPFRDPTAGEKSAPHLRLPGEDEPDGDGNLRFVILSPRAEISPSSWALGRRSFKPFVMLMPRIIIVKFIKFNVARWVAQASERTDGKCEDAADFIASDLKWFVIHVSSAVSRRFIHRNHHRAVNYSPTTFVFDGRAGDCWARFSNGGSHEWKRRGVE